MWPLLAWHWRSRELVLAMVLEKQKTGAGDGIEEAENWCWRWHWRSRKLVLAMALEKQGTGAGDGIGEAGNWCGCYSGWVTVHPFDH